MTEVAGKVAFITGGGSGVGLGQAKVFADAGCKVAIADIRQDQLNETMAYFHATDHEVMPINLDITDRDAYKNAADDVEVALGPDALIDPQAGLWPATDIVPFHYNHPVTGEPIEIDNSRAREGSKTKNEKK